MSGYRKDCPSCHGTGCVSGALYDPPEQCDCNDYEPDDIIDFMCNDDDLTDEQVEQELRDEGVDVDAFCERMSVTVQGHLNNSAELETKG